MELINGYQTEQPGQCPGYRITHVDGNTVRSPKNRVGELLLPTVVHQIIQSQRQIQMQTTASVGLPGAEVEDGRRRRTGAMGTMASMAQGITNMAPLSVAQPDATRPGQPPAILAGTPCPHEWRGACANCHQLLQPQVETQVQTQVGVNSMLGTGPGMAGIAEGIAGMDAAMLQNNDNAEVEMRGITVRQARNSITGVRVVDINGRARRAGLQIGDIVSSVNQKPTPTLEAFRAAMTAANKRANRGQRSPANNKATTREPTRMSEEGKNSGLASSATGSRRR